MRRPVRLFRPAEEKDAGEDAGQPRVWRDTVSCARLSAHEIAACAVVLGCCHSGTGARGPTHLDSIHKLKSLGLIA